MVVSVVWRTHQRPGTFGASLWSLWKEAGNYLARLPREIVRELEQFAVAMRWMDSSFAMAELKRVDMFQAHARFHAHAEAKLGHYRRRRESAEVVASRRELLEDWQDIDVVRNEALTAAALKKLAEASTTTEEVKYDRPYRVSSLCSTSSTSDDVGFDATVCEWSGIVGLEFRGCLLFWHAHSGRFVGCETPTSCEVRRCGVQLFRLGRWAVAGTDPSRPVLVMPLKDRLQLADICLDAADDQALAPEWRRREIGQDDFRAPPPSSERLTSSMWSRWRTLERILGRRGERLPAPFCSRPPMGVSELDYAFPTMIGLKKAGSGERLGDRDRPAAVKSPAALSAWALLADRRHAITICRDPFVRVWDLESASMSPSMSPAASIGAVLTLSCSAPPPRRTYGGSDAPLPVKFVDSTASLLAVSVGLRRSVSEGDAGGVGELESVFVWNLFSSSTAHSSAGGAGALLSVRTGPMLFALKLYDDGIMAVVEDDHSNASVAIKGVVQLRRLPSQAVVWSRSVGGSSELLVHMLPAAILVQTMRHTPNAFLEDAVVLALEVSTGRELWCGRWGHRGLRAQCCSTATGLLVQDRSVAQYYTPDENQFQLVSIRNGAHRLLRSLILRRFDASERLVPIALLSDKLLCIGHQCVSVWSLV